MTEQTAPAPAPSLFVELGVITLDQLKQAQEFQESFQKQGLSLPLANVIINLGLAVPERVARVLAHLGTAVLRCPSCSRRYTVPDFQAQRRYKCEPCRAYLEVVVDENLQPAAVQAPPAGAGAGAPPAAPSAAPLPAARKDPFEGKTLGNYRILRRIAKGGMGAVYLGERLEGGGQFAVKILTEEFSKMPGIQGRFKREATATGKLEHPNIVQTHEMGREENWIFIVMEYVDGGSLVDLIVKEKRLPPRRAVEIMCDILSGLHHAHERGIVHRDIKPGNVLLTSAGRAKVIDFGLAKDAEAQTILTLSGNVVGTPAYMAPEQAKGEGAGPPADQYSCGILTWLMLTGKKPFEGKSLVDTLNKQINEPLPSARALVPDLPEAIEKVIKRMAAKDPAKRFASLLDAARELRRAAGIAEPAAEASPVPAPPAPAAAAEAAAPWTWADWLLVAAAAGAGAALVWWLLQ
jgi:predicted Ser/Thr protein kinase